MADEKKSTELGGFLDILNVGNKLPQQNSLVFDPSFENLVPNFRYLDHILQGKRLEDLAKNWYIEPSPKKALTIPKQEGLLYFAADVQGCLTDWQMLVSTWLRSLANGENAYFVSLGDLNDALPELDEQFAPVCRQLEDKVGIEMHQRNLAIKDEENNRFMILAYPENSVQIDAQAIALRQLFGDRFAVVDADHEKQLRTPGFEIFKYNVNLTNHVRRKLSPEEAEYLRNELDKQPAVVKTENGYLFLHAGPLSKATPWKTLENLVRDHITPLKKDGEEEAAYTRRKIEWIEDSVEGRLIFGHSVEKDVKFRGGEGTYRVYADEEIEKTSEGASSDGKKVSLIISGHSGTAPLIHKTETDEIPYINGVDKYQQIGKQLIVATTEGAGCEKARSGENREGPNEYGVYGAIDLNEEFGTVYFGRLGEERSMTIFLTKNEVRSKVPTIIEKTTEKTIAEKLEEQMKACCYEKKWFREDLYKTFIKNMPLLKENLQRGVIKEKILESAIKKLIEENAKNVPEEIRNRIPLEISLRHFEKELRPYFTEKRL